MTCKQCFANQPGYFDELSIQNLVCAIVKIIDYSWVNGSYIWFSTHQSYTCFIKVLCVLWIVYEGGSESSVIGVITLLIDMISCCIIP